MKGNKMKIKKNKTKITLFGVLFTLQLVFLIFSIICFVICCIPMSDCLKEYNFDSSKLASLLIEKNLPCNSAEYADVIISVVISTSVALVSITATIFIFSKSALDRINDENNYVAEIVNIYKKETIKHLVKICIISVLLVIAPLLWHLLFSYDTCHMYLARLVGLGTLTLASILYFVFTCVFWHECICVEKALQRIIILQCGKLKENIESYLPKEDKRQRLHLIGDWASWEDEPDVDYFDEGSRMCRQMSADQFISLFQKAEHLLLSKASDQQASITSSSIITALNERVDILVPNIKVEFDDLRGRKYYNKNDLREIVDTIRLFEKRVGLLYDEITHSYKRDFFQETEELYSCLKGYRNLLISEKYTKPKVSASDNKKAEENLDFPESLSSLEIFTQALYVFFIRILVAFVSSTKIENASLNGCSLNYANLYSSSLSNISLYSSVLYRTVLCRTTFKDVIMDISTFFDIDFYSAVIIDSSFNNSAIENTRFERTSFQRVGFDSCSFLHCFQKDNDFEMCVFNNSEIVDTQFVSNDFTKCKFRDVTWRNCKITDCTFIDADIQKWIADEGFTLENCDFSHSIWRNMYIAKWEVLSGIFSDADLSSVQISNSNLASSSFTGTCLSSAKLYSSDFEGSTFQNASLYGAELVDVKLSTADFSNVVAVCAIFRKSKLNNCDCAETDFSSSKILNCNLEAARLYNCSMNETTIISCNCMYLIADHLQFTFSFCYNSFFNYSSFADTNMTKTKFFLCDFTGGDLSNLNATKTHFNDCRLYHTDFSGTRFVEASFKFHKKKKRIIRNCNFSSCVFEKVCFKNVRFVNCIFEDAKFIDCYMETQTPLNEDTFGDITEDCHGEIEWI